MMITRLFTVAVVAGVLSAGAGMAQTGNRIPAEFPPATYMGKQYVDSAGCVFIRAGIDGNVTWVPRMTRARETVCGFKPTGIAPQVAAAAAPVEAPTRITLNAPVAPAVAPESLPQVRAAAVPQPRPAPVVVRQSAPVARVAPAAVRTSTHAAIPAGVVARAARVSAASLPGDTVIVPKHVAIDRLDTDVRDVPAGYRKVFDDGRLNPRRAEQTISGHARMSLVWTHTVPRRLIDRRSGRDVTATSPLIYPYLDVATQTRALGTVRIVQRDGRVVKQVVRTAPAAVVRKPVYSSRSTPASAQPRAAEGHRFVQVGSFADPANAQRTARRLQKMGMPARISQIRSQGRTLMVVQAGPFDGGQTPSAVARLRGAGFRDAFARN